MSVCVYKFGLLPPTRNGDLVRAQMNAAHKYRNVLIEIERDRRAAVRAEEELHGDVAALVAAVESAEAVELAAGQAVKAARAATRSRSESREQTEALKTARAATREAKRALAEVRKAIRTDPTTIARMDEIAELSNDLVRGARALASDAGLYWGTYLLAEAAVEASAKMPLRDGAAPNDPHFVRWTGDAAVGVQIQQQAGNAPFMSANIFGNDNRIRIAPVSECAWHALSRGERRRAQRTTLSLRIGSEGRAPIWAEWPMVMHRPLPEEGVIKRASVHVQKVGPTEEWSVVITVDTSAVRSPQSAAEGAVSVDVGWRVIGDEIRVATWRGSDGATGELRLTAQDLWNLRKPAELQSVRDKLFNEAKHGLSSWMNAQESIPAWLMDGAKTLPQWESPSKLAALVIKWRENHFDGDGEVFGRAPTRAEQESSARGVGMEGWRWHDKHIWSSQENLRKQSLRRRREVYRIFAAKLANKYRTLVLEDFDLRSVARRSSKAENETARANRQLVATSELRNVLVNAFRMRGGTDEEVPAEDSTHTCAVCGLIENFDAAATVHHACGGCGAVWDQDENAAIVLLARWERIKRERLSAAQNTGPARNDENASDSAEVKKTKWERVGRLRAEKEARMGTARKPACEATEGD